MTASIPSLLQPLKDRLAAATPGPWETREDNLYDEVDVVHDQEQVSFVASCGDKHGPRVLADAEFIAHAPTDQAKLIAAVEAVETLAAYWEETPALRKGTAAKDLRAALTQALGGDTA